MQYAYYAYLLVHFRIILGTVRRVQWRRTWWQFLLEVAAYAGLQPAGARRGRALHLRVIWTFFLVY